MTGPGDQRHGRATDDTWAYERVDEPDRGGPVVNTGRLWAGGLATAVVAALIGVVGVLIVRAVLPNAERAGFDDDGAVLLCVVAAAAALAATGLAHLLLVSTPRPLAYLGWIVALITAATVVLPFTGGGSAAVKIATAAIHLLIGIAIGSLVSGAAAAAVRRPPPRY